MTGFDVLTLTLNKRNQRVLDEFVWITPVVEFRQQENEHMTNKEQSFRSTKVIIGISRLLGLVELIA
jgi:hypothetical protein